MCFLLGWLAVGFLRLPLSVDLLLFSMMTLLLYPSLLFHVDTFLVLGIVHDQYQFLLLLCLLEQVVLDIVQFLPDVAGLVFLVVFSVFFF